MPIELRAEVTRAVRPIFLPVDTDVLFANHKGVYKRGIEKRKTKLLRKLAFLTNFLDADEKIVFLTTGCSPFSSLEQLTIGVGLTVLLKRALFVFTNKRLLHIPTTWTFDYRGSIAQILYQDCRRLYVKGGRLVAEYHNGRTEKFLYIPRPDRQVIEHLQLPLSEAGRPSENPQRNHVCPNCTQVLPARTATCPSCGLEFKNRNKALTWSLLLPGGGYFYTGHPLVGIGDALGETYLVILTLGVLCAGLLGDPEALATLPILLVILALEKLLTVYHSNSFLAEFIPADLNALLRGRPVQRIQMEVPPQPEPPEPEPQRRAEEILSVR